MAKWSPSVWPVKVHQHIHLQLADQGRDLMRAAAAHIVKGIESPGHATPDGAGIVGAGGKAQHLEARAIVLFDQLRDQKRHRMLTIVGGEITDAPARSWP